MSAVNSAAVDLVSSATGIFGNDSAGSAARRIYLANEPVAQEAADICCCLYEPSGGLAETLPRLIQT